MKKLYYSLSLIAGFGLLACGRPSTSNYFELDGVGDPNNPITANPIPGKWAGNVNFTHFRMLPPNFSAGLFGGTVLPDFLFPQAAFNTSEIGGLGGYNLLISNAVPAPPRLEFGQVSACYMDASPSPLLGGNLNSVDVGDDIEVNPDGANNTYNMSRFGDGSEPGPDEILFWYTILETTAAPELLPFGEPIELSWAGGNSSGYRKAPPLQEQEIIEFPQTLMTSGGLPLVNGVTMTENIEIDDDYRIQWDEQGGSSDVIGIEIVVSVYGPTDFGAGTPEFDVADTPMFGELARIVCLVVDDEEEFTIFQSAVPPGETDAHSPFTIDDVIAYAKGSGEYAFSTEDSDGDGRLDVRDCGGIPQRNCVEDANGNNLIDDLYGVALSVSRRSERVHQWNLGSGNDRVLVSANELAQAKFRYGAPPNQCNNGLDDDLDGEIDDQSDPGCTDEFDNSEVSACADGIDNDFDGLIDFAQKGYNGPATGGLVQDRDDPDPDCSNYADDNEGP